MASAEPPSLPPPTDKASLSLCQGGDSEFQSISNALGDPRSGYHGNISRCHAGVKIQLAVWGADDILYGLASSTCREMDIGPLDPGFSLPVISYDPKSMNADISAARVFLEGKLRRFRTECGLAENDNSEAFTGFEEILEGELAKAWIKQRYGELLGEALYDEELRMQAIAEYHTR